MNRLFLLYWFIVLFSVQGIGQTEISRNIYDDFAAKGFNREEAKNLINEIIESFSDVQDNFGIVASKPPPGTVDFRYQALTEAVSYFTSPESIIEVTNINKKTTNRFGVEMYLHRLIGLRHYKVTLFWDNRLTLSKLYSNTENGYTVALGAWQYFVARNSDGIIVYKDKTYKKAFFTLQKRNGKWKVKIDEITAEETKEFILQSDY